MKVCGYNSDSRLGGSVSGITSKSENIKIPCQSPLNVPSLLSISCHCPSVWIKQNGEAFAVGPNNKGRIISTISTDEFSKDTKLQILDQSGQPCKFISAVCGMNHVLYQVSGKTKNDKSRIVYSHLNQKTTFLNIGNRVPVSLFGGYYTAAVIDTEGAVIIITKSVFNSPDSEIEGLSLPGKDIAVKVACGDDIVMALGMSGSVYECSLKTTTRSFVPVSELSGIKINEISGTRDHFFAISDDNKIFGRGSNAHYKLGMPPTISDVPQFKVVDSLNKYKIVEAFAGDYDSYFKTAEGKIIGCGYNLSSELMLKDCDKRNVYPPKETLITSDATFCIPGNCTTIVFVGVEPPPNTPNRKIDSSKFGLTVPKSSASKPNVTPTSKPNVTPTSKPNVTPTSKPNVAPTSKPNVTPTSKPNVAPASKPNVALTSDAGPSEIEKMRQMLIDKEKEISSLKEEVKHLKEKISSIKEPAKTNFLEIIDIDTLDNLKRIKSLGRGATSEVFEVTRAQRFALKVYYPELCKEDDDDPDKIVIDIESVKKFIQEYEFLNRLNHPSIIKAFGISFGDSNHPPAILLEYCPSNLKKKIKKLTKKERIDAIIDISSAMKEVHSIGIIHRDLKLENILLDENNKIKVSDFGLCTLITLDSETMSRTQMTGTLKYMAPELVNESSDYNEKVDVYSFGVVVFLILNNGEFPKISIVDVGIGKKAEIPSQITEFSRSLINKCWSFKADDRPSFAEICQMLKGNENKII